MAAEFVDDTSEYVDVCVGDCLLEDSRGLVLVQEDYRVGGEVWRVHKCDPDPFPSRPHAHCVSGKLEGYTLHLGTRELFDGRRPLPWKLDQDRFERLIQLIQPKFPDVALPVCRD
jgi:hypothetical protein